MVVVYFFLSRSIQCHIMFVTFYSVQIDSEPVIRFSQFHQLEGKGE